MCYCTDNTRSILLCLATLLLAADVHADELLPTPLPVLRIGAPQSRSESVMARRGDTAPEIITEKYPNRKVKIERQVVQDDERNYVNHGPWKMWDPQGRLVAHGEFRYGKQHGNWVRLMSTFGTGSESFLPPFTSQADFDHGQLHGTWTISDSRQRMIGSWEFNHGELHGKVTYWYSNGQPQREMSFKYGKLDGEVTAFTMQGTIANREYFRDARELIPVVTWHEPQQQKQAEGWMQTSEVTVAKHIDWWNGILQITREPTVGEPVRVGQWTEWHANGTKRFSGSYRNGEPDGDHIWWHENGQKQLVGRFEDGDRVDRWTRWHPNGRKQEEGEFYVGTKRGVWKAWSDDGQLIDEEQLAVLPEPSHSDALPANLPEIELVPIHPVSIDP